MTIDTPVIRVKPDEVKNPIVMAVDIGTSSIRVSLFDATGHEIQGCEYKLVRGLETTADGGSQIDAETAVDQVFRAIDALFKQMPFKKPIVIDAVGVSCFWHSLLGIDSEGNARTPVYGWADTRAAEDARNLRRGPRAEDNYQQTGAKFHPSYWPAKLSWIRRTQPGVFRSVRKWISLSDLLFLKLTGELGTSVSTASGTGMFNRFSCAWHEPLLENLSISTDSLPDILTDDKPFQSPTSEFTKRWPALSSAQWYTPIGDGAANNLGAGCVSRNEISLMIGTSGAMRLMFRGDPPLTLESGLWCYRLDRARPIVGGALSDGGGLFAWMIKNLDAGKDLDAIETELSRMQPDDHGLTVLPFWAGERSTGWHESARGSILGFTLHTRPIEVVRAAMEAVAYRFGIIAEALLRISPDAKIIGSGGALNASNAWAQILADVIGKKLTISENPEASSRGAALYALEHLGVRIVEEKRSNREEFEPDDDRHEVYRQARNRQNALYEKLIAE